jgi:hypothetical protein
MVLLHLVLTYHWYDETAHGSKRIEYREMTPRWRKLIFDKRDEITHVRFARGYTATMQTYEVEKIDVGSCPIDGWNDQYYRIHFSRTQRMSMYERQRNTLPHSDLLEIRVNRFIDHDSHKPQ